MSNDKNFLTSKTLWVNVIAAVAAVSGAFGVDLGLDADTQMQVVAGVLAVVNIVLRLVTKGAVNTL